MLRTLKRNQKHSRVQWVKVCSHMLCSHELDLTWLTSTVMKLSSTAQHLPSQTTSYSWILVWCFASVNVVPLFYGIFSCLEHWNGKTFTRKKSAWVLIWMWHDRLPSTPPMQCLVEWLVYKFVLPSACSSGPLIKRNTEFLIRRACLSPAMCWMLEKIIFQTFADVDVWYFNAI